MGKKLVMGEIAEKLSNFVRVTRFSDLPEDVVRETKYVLLDAIGCAIGGLSSDAGRISVELARRLGGPHESTIIGTSDRVSCANAAFANGQLINAKDHDAICALHDCPATIAAALASAENAQASGKDLILAIALGHEVDTRIASATGTRAESWGMMKTIKDGPDKGKVKIADVYGHSHVFGAAVCAGKIMNLDQEQMANAMGIAGYCCIPNTMAKWSDVSPARMTKYGLLGWVAHTGVIAALLAEMEFTGDTTLFEGEYGFWKYTGWEEWNTEVVCENLGREWRQKIRYKHYPAGM